MKQFYKSLCVYQHSDIAYDVFVAYRKRPVRSEISCVRIE
jgi:hypothetical protein